MTINASEMRKVLSEVLTELPTDPAADLWEEGVMDSYAVIEVVNVLEERFGIPFAPSIHNRGEAMCARGPDKAIRFLNCGQLPLDTETRQFHAEAMQERQRKEMLREDQGYMLIERDAMQVAAGQFEHWPLAE